MSIGLILIKSLVFYKNLIKILTKINPKIKNIGKTNFNFPLMFLVFLIFVVMLESLMNTFKFSR